MPTEPKIVTEPAIDTTSKSKRNGTRNPREAKKRLPRNSTLSATLPDKRNSVAPQSGERATKQERVLTLLNRPQGASIEEIMQATGWQQHSVRSFLAGTVKKKLRFHLTSSKVEGEARCYRIEPRRGD